LVLAPRTLPCLRLVQPSLGHRGRGVLRQVRRLVGAEQRPAVDAGRMAVVPGDAHSPGADEFSVESLRAATAGSVNCAFARTELAVGFSPIIDTAHKMGIMQNTLKPVLTLTLGAVETTALEMATVASTVAAEGVHHPPVFVSKIIGPDGQTIFDDKAVPGVQVISKDSADCETDLLHGVVTGGTGTGAQLDGRPVAGKTGTTDNLTDANFLGFTPQLATFIWHGNPVGRVAGAGFGGNLPAMAFRDFMNAALQGLPALPLPDPGPSCARPGTSITENGRGANTGPVPNHR
jgi:penicillin-binding protein 1A